MQKFLFIIISTCLLISCKKETKATFNFPETTVSLATHKLSAQYTQLNSKYLVVFESGLGDDRSVWKTKETAMKIGETTDVVIYDRAGYGKSTIGSDPRNIARLTEELEAVVDQFADGRKVILVGHSLGGLVVRDYAIKNAQKVAGIIFVDPTHEDYNSPTQAMEDLIFNSFSAEYGSSSGAAKEARELIEDLIYASSLPNLPQIPVVVLTSMKNDQANINSDQANQKTRQDWFNAHESLKTDIIDFTHIATTNSGHYIMLEEPDLIINQINSLISKLP